VFMASRSPEPSIAPISDGVGRPPGVAVAEVESALKAPAASSAIEAQAAAVRARFDEAQILAGDLFEDEGLFSRQLESETGAAELFLDDLDPDVAGIGSCAIVQRVGSRTDHDAVEVAPRSVAVTRHQHDGRSFTSLGP